MCKFNNRLFVFAVYCLLGLMVSVWAKPVPQDTARNGADDLGALVALSALMNSQDLHYDQRQKGEENYRIKLDGFFIGLPQEDNSALLLLSDDVFEGLDDDDNILAFGKNKHAATAAALTSVAPLAPSTASASTVPELNADINSNAAAAAQPTLVVEIPASKKYLEARHSVDSISKTKSYVSQFLNLLKRVRKH